MNILNYAFLGYLFGMYVTMYCRPDNVSLNSFNSSNYMICRHTRKVEVFSIVKSDCIVCDSLAYRYVNAWSNFTCNCKPSFKIYVVLDSLWDHPLQDSHWRIPNYAADYILYLIQGTSAVLPSRLSQVNQSRYLQNQDINWKRITCFYYWNVLLYPNS